MYSAAVAFWRNHDNRVRVGLRFEERGVAIRVVVGAHGRGNVEQHPAAVT
jgi:hypothetical protein